MILKATRAVLGDLPHAVLALSLGLNFLALDYVIFSQSTTFTIFFSQNSVLFNWTSIGLSLATAALFGQAVAMVVYVVKKNLQTSAGAAGGGLFGAGFGAIASGCPVCGAWLLPMLGIAGSLAAFPFQGLEIKALAVLLLVFSIRSSAGSVLGLCSTRPRRMWVPLAISAAFVGVLYALPNLPQHYKFNFSQRSFAARAPAADTVQSAARQNDLSVSVLVGQMNPEKGFTINARFGQIGKRLVEDGVIDFERFKAVYDRAGAPLTQSQLRIFEDGLDENITITGDNAYFLLNFFWAFGLANQNPILDEGEIAQFGEGQIGTFASTGGWTIATKPVMDIYSKSEIIVLTEAQQARVLEVAGNTYRPCCGNSTAFPDCNHGMALLGMLQVLAASDASVDDMYRAAKYFNAFWFPSEYFDLALYFKARDGLDFADIDARKIVGAEYSSGFGWTDKKKWLAQNNLIEQPPAGGGGCGV
ncbi:hypothetical protein MNBD_ALPHA09-2255 [hydrothermal vent metagenome]|uniref:Uncharacterized protein n=2 Tax=hydrothermal vent metagenome TaxID=652676 RepID=A0A3B0SWP6_9ZZZZ